MNTLRTSCQHRVSPTLATRIYSTGAGTNQAPASVLVGTPDMVSNLRPAIYDGVWFKAVSTPPDPSSSPSSLPSSTLVYPEKNTEHPYALNEFPSKRGAEGDRFFEEKQSWNLQHRLLKQSLDAFNHAYWTDSNTRFNTYKHFVENSTKSYEEYQSASSDEQELMLERETAAFYRAWQVAEGPRQKAYTKELHRRTFELIWFGARHQLQKLRWAVRAVMTKEVV
ncbi:hypothetical protein FRB99_008476 [Tulasnella sp. 403]|nr:hypothetical protein FRB99_008476 [Tulasnella sp. 403]